MLLCGIHFDNGENDKRVLIPSIISLTNLNFRKYLLNHSYMYIFPLIATRVRNKEMKEFEIIKHQTYEYVVLELECVVEHENISQNLQTISDVKRKWLLFQRQLAWLHNFFFSFSTVAFIKYSRHIHSDDASQQRWKIKYS